MHDRVFHSVRVARFAKITPRVPEPTRLFESVIRVPAQPGSPPGDRSKRCHSIRKIRLTRSNLFKQSQLQLFLLCVRAINRVDRARLSITDLRLSPRVLIGPSTLFPIPPLSTRTIAFRQKGEKERRTRKKNDTRFVGHRDSIVSTFFPRRCNERETASRWRSG